MARSADTRHEYWGSLKFDFGTVKYTQAFHSSSYTTEANEIIYTGMPAGILFTAEDKMIYHAGDTSIFGDMELLGRCHPIDVAFVPIGDNFTMGPQDAAFAVELLKSKAHCSGPLSIHFLLLNRIPKLSKRSLKTMK